MKKINKFAGEYAFLSMSYRYPTEYKGVTFPSLEHAYHAMKSDNPADWERLSGYIRPVNVRAASRTIKMRSDWNMIRDSILLELNMIKFSDPVLRQKLNDTGDSVLVYDNRDGDQYLGVFNKVGDNMLGKTLMKIRDSL